MSLLLRLKNKLQDPSSHETKLREFDECMFLLKNENAELHKRIDHLEALYKTSLRNQQKHFLEEHIRQLEQENERLFIENQCQRQEYERFLEQLSTMIIRTAIMQENIRKECASISHIIERLSTLKLNAVYSKESVPIVTKRHKRSVSWENFNKSCEMISHYHEIVKLTENLIRSPSSALSTSSSSSSSSSSKSSPTTHCSLSTSDSWTLDLSFESKDMKTPVSMLPQPTVEDKQQQQNLQRSETFTVSKLPPEQEPSSSLMNANENDHKNETHPSKSQTNNPPTLASTRPSKLPSRNVTSKIQPSNNSRSSSASKTSKLPIRTTKASNEQQSPMKKSNPSTSVTMKTKTEVVSTPRRSAPSPNTNAITKRTIRPPVVVQSPTNKARLRSTTVAEKNSTKSTTTSTTPTILNKTAKPIIEVPKVDCSVQQMNSTSSDSSIEEQQKRTNNLVIVVQDDGYSTWSSVDVKDDGLMNSTKKNESNDKTEHNMENIDILKDEYAQKPVLEVENDICDEKLLFLCPFAHDDDSSDISISHEPAIISASDKDISLDSLDNPSSKEQQTNPTTTAIFSRSDTFDKELVELTSPTIVDDHDDSISSTSSSSTFNMCDYIEDHFIDEDDHSSERSSSYETTIINQDLSTRPQKRLLFPGVLNRLIFLRRILSDSDLQLKKFCLNETENEYHVYHSNIINDHSVEINLTNTYGSDSELQVWSHNCAEQRKFLHERQQQLKGQIDDSLIYPENCNQQLALERQILLQQIYEYPWLLQENDLDQTTVNSPTSIEQTLCSPTSDLIVPIHNPDFYQLCALTNSSSFVISYEPNAKHTNPTTTSPVL